MDHHHMRCPNCGRETTENESYCYFCEMDLHELSQKSKENSKKKQKNKFFGWKIFKKS